MSTPTAAPPAQRRNRAAARALWLSATFVAAALIFLAIDATGGVLLAPPLETAPAATQPSPGHGTNALVRVLFALAAVLATGRLLGVLFRFLGQPPVIAEVVAGIALGPSLLGQLWPEAADFILPATVAPQLGVLSQLGVVLYMFLVGLELDLTGLRGQAHTVFAIAHASIALPFLLGATVALALFPAYAGPDVTFTTFALFVGVATAITAFPVLARILTDRRMHTTALGVLALGVAAINDAVAWCLLAFVVGVARAEVGGALLVLLLTATFFLVMFGVVRPIATRWIARAETAGFTQGTLATVLVAVLLCALAAEAIGVHALFGAFLLGAILPHDGTTARALATRIEDLVTVLLLPAFFAYTGMRTRIGLLAGGEGWLLCGLIVVVATAGKVGGTFAAARSCGLGNRDAAALGVLMNTRGLMELIALNVGLELHIISPALFAMMVVMSLVTTMATGPLLHGLDRRQVGASASV